MKVSILGNSLTSLTLAKLLVNEGFSVDIFSGEKVKKNSKIQTLGISKSNIDFFNTNILNIKKLVWNINQIEIFSESLENSKILNFQNENTNLFSIIRNSDLYNNLLISLKKNKLINFKRNISEKNLEKNNYKLVFNCDYFHPICKKFFYKKMEKDYNSVAYITTFKHKNLTNNHVASQIFTKKGPFAFLPISSNETSVVYSYKGTREVNLESFIEKYNTKYKITKMNKFLSFKLKSSNLRSYYYKNIIAFGDLLHRVHPLAGQGFNMTIRDIKEIHNLIRFKKVHGLDLDSSICFDFEKNVRNKNYLFSNSIDFIYEFFNFENKINNKVLSRTVQILGKNKTVNKLFTKFADNGLVI